MGLWPEWVVSLLQMSGWGQAQRHQDHPQVSSQWAQLSWALSAFQWKASPPWFFLRAGSTLTARGLGGPGSRDRPTPLLRVQTLTSLSWSYSPTPRYSHEPGVEDPGSRELPGQVSPQAVCAGRPFSSWIRPPASILWPGLSARGSHQTKDERKTRGALQEWPRSLCPMGDGAPG